MGMGHLKDPLDYLYEELSAEEMAEAREHLQSCADCREQIAHVRDTVKAYRRLPRAEPPSGLAERTAALVLSRTNRAPHPEAEPVPEPEPAIPAPYYNPPSPGIRRWLFHPAWPVAALVMLCCSLLILASPRAHLGAIPALFPDESALDDAESARTAPPRRAQRERPAPSPAPLPVATRGKTAMAAQVSLPPVPQLAEAEAWQSAEAKMEPAAVPERPMPALAAAAPAPAIASEALPPVVLYAESGTEDNTLQTLRHRYPDIDIQPLPELPSPPEPEEAAAFAAPAAPLSDAPFVESDAEALAGGGGDVLIDMMPPGPPPQIIPRPEAVDSLKAARDLSFLIGLQMGHGEYSDALISISLLRHHDPEKAAELLAVLDGLLAEHAQADIESEPASPAQPADTEESPQRAQAASALPEPSEPPASAEPEMLEFQPETSPTEPAPDKYYRIEPQIGVGVPNFTAPEPRFPSSPRTPFTTDPYFRGD